MDLVYCGLYGYKYRPACRDAPLGGGLLIEKKVNEQVTNGVVVLLVCNICMAVPCVVAMSISTDL